MSFRDKSRPASEQRRRDSEAQRLWSERRLKRRMRDMQASNAQCSVTVTSGQPVTIYVGGRPVE